jgi:sugar lactone lactonase YvrE
MKISRISFLTSTVAFLFAATVFCFYITTPGEANRSILPGGVTVTTVASELHNPRGLNFAPDGSLYVAEAGGNGTASSLCGVMGDGATKCFAETGSITRIDLESGVSTRVLNDLPSLIAPNGTAAGATGVHDVSFQGFGNTYMTVGLGVDPNLRDDYFGVHGSSFARLARSNPSGKFRLQQDLGAFEADNNPDGVVPDSNPYGLLALPGKVIIADAGGNDLLQVSAKGGISVLAVFSPLPRPAPGPPFVQAVPTSVALGPDGDYYVGVLTGGPFTVGLANVYRVSAAGGTPQIAFSGFTNIIDIAFGDDGSLFVLEIARNAIPNFPAGGRLVRIAPDGTRSDVISGPPLIAPGGIAVGDDGALYVTNRSTSATAGEVLKIELQ